MCALLQNWDVEIFFQVRSRHSSSSSTCANGSSCWDGAGDDNDVCNMLNIPVTTPENLYLMGKNSSYIYSCIKFSRLAEASIRSNLQMRTI